MIGFFSIISLCESQIYNLSDLKLVNCKNVPISEYNEEITCEIMLKNGTKYFEKAVFGTKKYHDAINEARKEVPDIYSFIKSGPSNYSTVNILLNVPYLIENEECQARKLIDILIITCVVIIFLFIFCVGTILFLKHTGVSRESVSSS